MILGEILIVDSDMAAYVEAGGQVLWREGPNILAESVCGGNNSRSIHTNATKLGKICKYY